MGYAYVVLFRKRPAYRFAVKHSIYVHHEHLGHNVGGFLLMHELIDACAAAGFRQMIGYIDADNTASLAFTRSSAFAGSARYWASPIDTVAGPTPSCDSILRRHHAPQRFDQDIIALVEGLRRGELAWIVAQSALTWDKNQRRWNPLLDRQCIVSRNGL